ncbi:MAG: hypothetical protein ABI847_17525 [Anaerolineales bacterium]
MNRIRFSAILTALVLATLACALPGNLLNQPASGDSDMQAVAELWSDVPPMDGMTTAQQVGRGRSRAEGLI